MNVPRASLRLQSALFTFALVASGCDDGASKPAASNAAVSQSAVSQAPAPGAHPHVGDGTGAHPSMPPGHPPLPGHATPGRAGPGHAMPGQASAPPTTGAASGVEGAGGLVWTSKAPLVRRPPASRMRAAEYVVAGKAGEGEAVLTVFYFGPGQGGALDANLDRWAGQFQTAAGTAATRADATVAKRTVGETPVTTIDLSGKFTASMGPMMRSKPAEPAADHRMLGAIAEGPKGPVFFKLVGPKATVASAETAFSALVASLKPAP